jgi:general stress protein 26
MPTPPPLPAPPPLDPQTAKTRIAELLTRSRLMTIATLRPDGWPQATVVNYVAEGLSLFFVVSRHSQKLANIARDGRVAIALAADGAGPPVGLSMAAHVFEVNDPTKIDRLNQRIRGAAHDQPFTPHPAGRDIALLEARPTVLSLIDYQALGAVAQHFTVHEDWRLEATPAPAETPAP